MPNRETFHELLEVLLGSTHVYYSPPPTIQMQYPCIVYQRSKIDTKFADNQPYSQKTRYKVTVIDQNPDSVIPGRVSMLPLCVHETNFVTSNLNHDVFTIYI
jgi:hypothetical protein